MNNEILQSLTDQIQKVMDILKTDLGTIRTGRATPALVESLTIAVYGGSAKMRIMELATIGTLDAQTIVITPFDQSIINEVQKGIQDANTGLNPVVDNGVVRITIQPLSQERREELIKLMHHKLENGRVMTRQARHDAMDHVKKLEGISEDETERLEKEVQKTIDSTMSTIDGMGKQKEDELLQI
jgi:ribosome recycling factor